MHFRFTKLRKFFLTSGRFGWLRPRSDSLSAEPLNATHLLRRYLLYQLTPTCARAGEHNLLTISFEQWTCTLVGATAWDLATDHTDDSDLNAIYPGWMRSARISQPFFRKLIFRELRERSPQLPSPTFNETELVEESAMMLAEGM
jgi:hypothetical protein